MAESRQLVQPLVNSLLICEKVITAQGSGQQSLIGLVYAIFASRYPFQTPMLHMFMEVTGCHGQFRLTFRLIDANEDRPAVGQGKCETSVDDPLAVSRLVFPLPPMEIPEPGDYRLQVFTGDGPPAIERKLLFGTVNVPDQPASP
jgi:hypothetical protein